MKLLYSSNALWAQSGYGVQGRSLLPRLAELPEFDGRQNIAMFAWYGLQGGVHVVEGFRVYPAGMDPYGNDIIEMHAKNFGADIVITLIDAWVLKDTAKKVAPARWLPWLPIDHEPVPVKVLDALDGAHLPLTYSKWGHDLLAAAGVPNTYIPHGLEPDVYCVNPDRAAAQAFKEQLFPGATHLTIMVAANKGLPDRKAFQVQLRAWAKFATDKPGARLYLHTEPTAMYGGIDFPALLANLGIADKVRFPDRYSNFMGLPSEFMTLLYNAADVYLGSSMAEGFGIPLIEAQACGTPVIVTDFSAMPELVRWGYKVAPADMYWTALNSWQAWPDVHGIYGALCELYAEWERDGGDWALAKRQAVSAQIHTEYNWDTIVRDHWRPLISQLAGGAAQSTQVHTIVNAHEARVARVGHVEPVPTNGRNRFHGVRVAK